MLEVGIDVGVDHGLTSEHIHFGGAFVLSSIRYKPNAFWINVACSSTGQLQCRAGSYWSKPTDRTHIPPSVAHLAEDEPKSHYDWSIVVRAGFAGGPTNFSFTCGFASQNYASNYEQLGHTAAHLNEHWNQ